MKNFILNLFNLTPKQGENIINRTPKIKTVQPAETMNFNQWSYHINRLVFNP